MWQVGIATADSSAALRNDKQKDRQRQKQKDRQRQKQKDRQKQEQPQVLRLALRASLRMTISLAGFGEFALCALLRMTRHNGMVMMGSWVFVRGRTSKPI